MYAENGLMFTYFPQDAQQFDDFCCSQKPNASLDISFEGTPSSFVQTSDYNLGEEGDLFKAPEPVIQEPFMGLDPISAAISMISCGEDVILPQSLTVSDIESSIESGQLLSEIFYECRKDLLAKDGNETPFSEMMDIKIPTLKTDEELVAEGPFGKSVSSSCLRSMDYVPEAKQRPTFLDFPVSDIGGMYGMRRSFSEGDIKTLGNGDINTPGYDPAVEKKSKSKAAKRNERKKEKRLQAALDKDTNSEQKYASPCGNLPENVESVASKLNGLSLSGSASMVTPPDSSFECATPMEQVQDIDKKIRALKKKIRLTEAQQHRTAEKDLKTEQLEKVAKLEGWRNELKLLEDKKAELTAS